MELLRQSERKETHGFVVVKEENKDYGKNAFSAGLMKKMLKRRSTISMKKSQVSTNDVGSLFRTDETPTTPKTPY